MGIASNVLQDDLYFQIPSGYNTNIFTCEGLMGDPELVIDELNVSSGCQHGFVLGARSAIEGLNMGNDVQFAPSIATGAPYPQEAGLGEAIVNPRIPWAKQIGTCQYCGLQMRKKTLSRHIEYTCEHSSCQSRFRCDACYTTCARPDLLQRHILEQHGHASGSAGLVKCPDCGRWFRKRYLNDHRKHKKCTSVQVNSQTSGIVLTGAIGAIQASTPILSLELTMDAEEACSIMLAGLWKFPAAKPVSKHSPALHDLNGHLHRIIFDELRHIAIKSVQRELLSGSNRSLSQVFLMYMVDWRAFGKRSQEAKSHLRYIDRMLRTDCDGPRFFEKVVELVLDGFSETSWRGASVLEAYRWSISYSAYVDMYDLKPRCCNNSTRHTFYTRLDRIIVSFIGAVDLRTLGKP